ncbi:enoyl-CoA hydratase/isomerase family protein [Sphingobium tyrosinilyticum]|uniref:Enoyl-CoA hydratase/isomerase family protein n=1 Tax=Sphingobium tyrosinilyticum TaxID=2715436 RepID=A0ABV9F247_9SPHN
MTDSGGISFSIEDGVAHIVLDRPDSGNAIDLPLARSLLTAAIRCDMDDAVRCIGLRGRGRLFCAGGDVHLMGGAGDKRAELLSEFIATLHAAVQRLARAPKPLVTLINGPAAGAGFSLSMLGDVAIGARSVHFTAAYGALGLTSDGGLSWLLPRLLGLRKAQDILTNRRIMADEADAIGLVSRIVDDSALMDEGLKIAAKLADAPVAAVGAARALLIDSFETGLEVHLDRELRSMVVAAGRHESEEGLRALLEKRPAHFRGGRSVA